ncbi:MAG: hypothetical protein WD491_08985 [Balneolales bacterium]
MNIKLSTGLLFLASLLLFCNRTDPKPDTVYNQTNRIGGITINNSIDQAEHVQIGLQVFDDSHIAYGLDLRSHHLFKLSLESESLTFLSSVGRGPQELSFPIQLIMKSDTEFYVYDARQDMFAHFVNDEIIGKIPGYMEHNIWNRNSYGFYWNNHIITAIEDHEELQAMNIDQAKPLAFLNLDDNTLTKHGMMSPTIDKLDSYGKYPYIYFDDVSEIIYYAFRSDYTIMKYDIAKDTTFVASSYKPQKMRQRSIPVDRQSQPTRESARMYGLDTTNINGMAIIEDQLVVVWFNYTDEFYDNNSDYTSLDVYGVIYDLPNLDNPREFSLPGRFLGIYNNNLLVEENDDPINYTIGFYDVIN